MAHITLVLPFALPFPEFAPDLIRALDAPALSSLLSRTARATRAPTTDITHVLPHEAWLARELGLSAEGNPAFAAAAMRGFGLEHEGGTWYLVTPAHIQIARSHLMMSDTRQVSLSDADGRALFDAARALCEDIGHSLRYGDAHTWFLRADDWTGFNTASPDTVANMDLTDFMPKGPQALAYRRLQNEVQMAWHAHPANAAREERRLRVVNAFWVWGAGAALPTKAMTSYAVPGWMGALGQRIDSLADVHALIGQGGTLVVGNLGEAALAADWGTWLEQMHLLEQTLFAPLLAAVKDGRVGSLRLVLSSREALADYTTSTMAQRKFWRRPTLDSLL